MRGRAIVQIASSQLNEVGKRLSQKSFKKVGHLVMSSVSKQYIATTYPTLPGTITRLEACPLGMQAARSSIPMSGTVFHGGDYVMKKFLLPFSRFC